MFNWFSRKKDKPKEEELKVELPVVEISQEATSKPKKQRKPRKPKPKKEKVEPKVEILKFDFDPKDPMLGSIELDWNTEFVELLVKHGYSGNSAEDIVDSWLNDVCRNIVSNQFPGYNIPASSAQMVNRKNIGPGKTEIS